MDFEGFCLDYALEFFFFFFFLTKHVPDLLYSHLQKRVRVKGLNIDRKTRILFFSFFFANSKTQSYWTFKSIRLGREPLSTKIICLFLSTSCFKRSSSWSDWINKNMCQYIEENGSKEIRRGESEPLYFYKNQFDWTTPPIRYSPFGCHQLPPYVFSPFPRFLLQPFSKILYKRSKKVKEGYKSEGREPFFQSPFQRLPGWFFFDTSQQMLPRFLLYENCFKTGSGKTRTT